jgi:hypothetical protein
VLRHPKYDEIYIVTLKQGWNTTNYSDIGWLSLKIDFQEGDTMKVLVRTWEPEKLNGKELSEDERLNIWELGNNHK